MNKTNNTVSVEVPCLAKSRIKFLKKENLRIFSADRNRAIVIVNSCKVKNEDSESKVGLEFTMI
ncbi:MAG: hypothetical protein CMN54_14545 [SAR324 cluster bacterium]|uniref:Uncharacterized protein n=1 Tax=SAR324 cluster bacterium TaxID=2024889 RepID=A0A2D6YN88_9DELT|nr:hypothetical protein [SAR324 cluster bacterium]